jgi:hypothetical protein
MMADRNTLVPEFALVAKRQPLELSLLLHSFWLGRICEAAQFDLVCHPSAAHKPPRHHSFVQALGTAPTLTLHVEVTRGRLADALRSNQLWPVSVVCLPKMMHQEREC